MPARWALRRCRALVSLKGFMTSVFAVHGWLCPSCRPPICDQPLDAVALVHFVAGIAWVGLLYFFNL